jgi:tetratricopeptide (TPR) repeat protein
MKFWVILLFTASVYCQTELHSPESRKIFADHLYCSGDYLRAIDEYNIYIKSFPDDTAEFKIALALANIGKTEEADRKLSALWENSPFREYSLSERMRILINNREYEKAREIFSSDDSLTITDRKIRNITYLYASMDSLPSPPFILLPYNGEEIKGISGLLDQKTALPQKNPLLAGFLSAMVPGLGKIYTEEYGDAFFAAAVTGIFGYLAYSNFKADHKFRGFLFTGITAWFYGGNVYGSAVSANIYNARVSFAFSEIVDQYLRLKNYFLPDYGFCK